jgi:phage terminase large subunit
MKINEVFKVKLSEKQEFAYLTLENQFITELLYGGGAGGGKSWLGCTWLALNCINYQNTRWLMGRYELKALKSSTLVTFFKVCRKLDLRKDRDYKYNSTNGIITFINGSEILLWDLKDNPSDPDFESLGSLELTGAFVDEVSEISFKAYEVLKTRLSRHMTSEYQLGGQLFMSCNPSKNWLYREFYEPWTKGTLKPYQAFIPALVDDNDFVDVKYKQKLDQISDPKLRKRLRDGDWDYDDNPRQLIRYSWLASAGTKIIPHKGHRSATLDVAREGNDKCVMSIKIDNTLCDMREIKINITSETDISGQIAIAFVDYCRQNNVGYENAWIDIVGVGGGVLDACRRLGFYARGYIGGGRVEIKQDESEYLNMRAYSYWQFRIAVQSGELKIYTGKPEENDQGFYIENLDELYDDLTAPNYEVNDSKIKIEAKEDIKKRLGRSTDWGDSAVMHYVQIPVEVNRVATVSYLENRNRGYNSRKRGYK